MEAWREFLRTDATTPLAVFRAGSEQIIARLVALGQLFEEGIYLFVSGTGKVRSRSLRG